MASQFGSLYLENNNRMSVYLDIIRCLDKQFELVAIFLKPRNDIRHTDELFYLAIDLENDSSRKISIDSQERPNLSWVKSDLKSIFLATRVFLAHVYK